MQNPVKELMDLLQIDGAPQAHLVAKWFVHLVVGILQFWPQLDAKLAHIFDIFCQQQLVVMFVFGCTGIMKHNP